MNPDDEFSDDREPPVPSPDDPADAGERARARAFAELIDKVIAGRPPAAVPAEDRALLETATALRATVRPVELGPHKRSAVVDAALATALARKAGPARPGVSGSLPVIPLPTAPRRVARVLPWVIAGATSLVAAAALVLWLRERAPAAAPAPVATAPLPLELRSRPADALIGVIDRDRAGAAIDRIDAIYADRLSGFRERTMMGGRR